MRTSDWSSDVCSADLGAPRRRRPAVQRWRRFPPASAHRRVSAPLPLHLASRRASARRQPALPNPHFRIPVAFQQSPPFHPYLSALFTPPSPPFPSPNALLSFPHSSFFALSFSPISLGMRCTAPSPIFSLFSFSSFSFIC